METLFTLQLVTPEDDWVRKTYGTDWLQINQLKTVKFRISYAFH